MQYVGRTPTSAPDPLVRLLDVAQNPARASAADLGPAPLGAKWFRIFAAPR